MQEILGYIIPVASIALSYAFGRLQAAQSEKTDAYREAYRSFYLPYIALLYKTQIWDCGFSSLNFKYRHEIFTLVISNIQYMDENVIDFVDVFYSHYEMVIAKEITDISYPAFSPARLDEVFDLLTMQVLSRASILAKKLHQPQLGEFVRQLYLSEKEAREKQQKEAKPHKAHINS